MKTTTRIGERRGGRESDLRIALIVQWLHKCPPRAWQWASQDAVTSMAML
jgi:hypothetical protein